MVMRLKDVGHYQPMLETNQGDNCLEQLELTPRTRLMGDFLYKGDFAVLCGAEGSGKSILAFQLADALSKGKPVEGFANDCDRQRVLFLDFENKHERFIRRYSQEGQNKYKLSSGFFRTTFSSKFTEYVGLRKEFHVEMNRRVPGREPEVLIVNNLDVAKCFISESFLIALLREYQARLNLTVVLVTSINPGKTPVYLNRLGKNLRGMADSVIAIGHSKKAKNIRYLKQLKSSTGETTYDENELPEFTIEQRGNFTGFYHNGFSWEDEHLAGPPTGLALDIINLKNQQPNLTYKEIADKLETNKTRVMRALDRRVRSSSEHGLSGLGDFTDGGQTERGLRGLEDCADEGKSGQTVGAVVTSTLKNDGSGSAILCHAEAGGRLEARQRIVGIEGKQPPANFERGFNGLGDCADEGETEQTVGAVVTNTLKKDTATEVSSFSNPRLQTVGIEEVSSPFPLLLPTTYPQGGMPNAEPLFETVEPLPTDPFRGEVEHSGHPSDPGVKSDRGLSGLGDCAEGGKSEQSVGAVVTSTLKNDKSTDAPSFSNPRLQAGELKEVSSPCPLLSPTTCPQGGMSNAEPLFETIEPLPTDPFRGEVGYSEHPSDSGVKSEHGLSRLGDCADEGETEQTVGAVVTNTLKKDTATEVSSFSNPRLQAGGLEEVSSPCPLLSPTTCPQGGMPNAEPLFETVEPSPTDPFRGEVEHSGHPSDPGVKSDRGLSGLGDCAEGGKSDQTVGAVVTNTLKNDKSTDAPSFSTSRLQAGGEELQTDSLHQGNDSPHHTKTPAPLPTDPFRGEVGSTYYPSDPGVKEETLEESLKTLDALITSYCKPQPKARNNEPGPQKKPLTYSQELKKRLAQARMTKKK